MCLIVHRGLATWQGAVQTGGVEAHKDVIPDGYATVPGPMTKIASAALTTRISFLHSVERDRCTGKTRLWMCC
jgi:hypothetical protein